MKIKKTFKRILSIAISLLIVISAASGAIYSFAAVDSSDYTVNTAEFSNDSVSAMGESLVASVEFESTLDGGATFKTQNPGTDMTANLIDGKVTTQCQIYNNSPVIEGNLRKGYFHDYEYTNEDDKKLVPALKAKYLDGTIRKLRVTLVLKGRANVDNILLAHAGGSGESAGELSIANYAVFAADSKADLYNKNNAKFYHLYDNASANKKYQNYTFGEDKLKGVRYVGIEIYNPHISWLDSYITQSGVDIFYPRINEFNVFGTILPENVIYDDGALLTPEEKGDLTLLSSSISAKVYRNGVEYASGKECSNLIDEDLSTTVGFMQSGDKTDEWAFYEKNGAKFKVGGQDVNVTMNFTIKLQPESLVKKLVFVNASANTKFTATEYQVYAANTEADLFNAENRLENIVNTNLKKRQIINVPDGVKANYVGFRLIECINPDTFDFYYQEQNYAVPRIAQLGVYGANANEIDNAKITRLSDKTIPSDIGTILTGTNTIPEIRYYSDHVKQVITLDTTKNLYDGDSTTGYHTGGKGVIVTEDSTKVVKTYDDGYYYEIEYDLGTFDTIKKVFVAHHHDTWNTGMRSPKYEIYASNNKENLWDKDNKVAYVVTNDSMAQVISFKEAVVAKYVGMRMLETVRQNTTLSSDGYLRLFEFSVYGEKGNNTLVSLKTDSSTIEIPEGKSVVKRMSAKFKGPSDSKANPIEVSFNSSITPSYSVLEGLTTAKTVSGVKVGNTFAKEDGSGVTIYRDGTTAYADIVYTLENKSIVSDIFVAEHSDKKFKISYKLYASDSEDTLFDGKPLYTYNNTDETYFQHYEIAGVSVSYVGLRITASVSSDDYSSYSAYGVDNLYPLLFGFGVLGEEDISIREPQEGTNLPLPTGESAVETVNAYYFDGNRKPNSLSGPKYLLDKDLGNNTTGNFNSSPFAYKDGNKTEYYTDRYMDIVLNLKGMTQLSDVYIAHHSNPDLMTREYALYIGEDKDTLFDGEPYYICDNNDLKKVQHYIFNGLSARFVGIRITKACGTAGYAAAAENCYIRLLEFNAFGEVTPDPIKPWTYQKITYLSSHKFPLGINFDGLTYLNHKNNFLGAKSSWADIGNEESMGRMSSADNMNDGDFKTQNALNIKFAEYNIETKSVVDYTKGRVRYQTIWYDLMSEADLSFINIAFPTSNPIWTAGEYEVYISNNKESLFKGTPYATVDNYSLRKEGTDTLMNIIAFDKSDNVPDVARYVGIKIYNPINVGVGEDSWTTLTETSDNHIYTRIQEFQIYGNYVDSDFEPANVQNRVITTVDFGDLSKLTDVYGDNLLISKNTQPTISGGKAATATHTAKLKQVINRKGNELNGSHVDFSGITSTSDYAIYFKLDQWEVTRVKGFAFQGFKSDNSMYFASDYEVYVLEEKEDLATAEPIFHYTTDEYPLSSGQIIEFGKEIAPQGKWLVFKLNNPVYTATAHNYFRVAMIYAWGDEAYIPAVPANIAENMPCEVSFLNGNKRTAVSEKNLTPKELGYMTDSTTIVGERGNKKYETNLKTYGVVNTQGKNRNTLEMVYNLCGDVEIDSIMVSTLIDNNTGFKTMKVYASSLLQGVYDEESIIWTYKVTSNGIVNPTKSFKKSKEMRYIRFVFEDTKDDVRIYTIDVIGLDNQKMKTRSLTSALTNSDLTVEKINLKTDVRSFYSNVYPERLNNVINGSVSDFLSFEEGNPDNTGYSLIIDLGDLKTVSKIELKFNYGYNKYWAKKIKVYVLETKQQLTNETNPIATVYPQKDGKATQEISMRPRLARYVKVDFLKFPKIEDFKMPDGSYKITSSIADIKITGTKVKGMQNDDSDERLISFIDKKTKAEISLVKLDENDIFTGVVSAKLVPEKATNRQMDSLRNNNLKIVDKTIYKVAFFDLYGNKVDNIGEREIQIRFPITKSEKGKMLIADVSNKTRVDALESFEINKSICANILQNLYGDTKVALLKLTTSDDPYWSQIGELEDFDVPEEEDYRDESWYDSIHTTDGRFVVTPLYETFESGLKFTATDITNSKTYNDYYNVLDAAYIEDEAAKDLQVAVFYDMKLSRNSTNVELADGAFADITYAMPDFIYNNYTDLRAFYIADTGEVLPLATWAGYNENEIGFQLEKMGKVAIVGTKLYNTDVGVISGNVPETGESCATTTAVLSLMVAAAFVAIIAYKRNEVENK